MVIRPYFVFFFCFLFYRYPVLISHIFIKLTQFDLDYYFRLAIYANKKKKPFILNEISNQLMYQSRLILFFKQF